MRSLDDVSPAMLKDIAYVLTDVDDTLTTNGKLHPEALQALWDLKRAGYVVIPVTGGSAGWADTYIRQWPIDAVITESGALAYYMQRGRRGAFYHPSIIREGYRDRADRFIERVLSEVPESKLSSDQFCRLFDIAFDHHSEEPYLGDDGIERIIAICEDEGASHGVSSIHVNCWFGDYDKLSMVRLFMQEIYDVSPEALAERAVYCGDSSNDIPLFKAFPMSFGVGSIKTAGWDPDNEPAFCADEPGGKGFVEIADLLLRD